MLHSVGLLLFLYISNINAVLDVLPCTTPEGEEGSCVIVDYCPSIIETLSHSNLTKEPVKELICNETTNSVCCTEPRNGSFYGTELSDRRYCGYQQFDNYQSQRNDTSIDEFPWLAAILGINRDTNEEEIFCQASLINKRYLLGSAQCFFGQHTVQYNITRVLLGKYSRNTDNDCIALPEFAITECVKTEEFQIEETIIHPFFFKRPGLTDISLLRLNRVVTYSDYIRPICLPIEWTISAKPGEILYTTGWGRTTVHSGVAVIKKKIATVLIANQECQTKYHKTEILPEISYMCTLDFKNNTAYSCQGDSGSPVMFQHRKQWHIEGIVSRGKVCANFAPGIHTRVAGYLEWIKQNMKP